MPLARIITDSVDESLELTMQLRSRGFQVETCAPGEVPSTPADLEVRLEECNSEDVLTQTAPVSDGDDLWVFVAPGALDDSIRPIRTIPLRSAAITPRSAPEAEPAFKFVPALVPNITPEDDPIMLELSSLSAQPGLQQIRTPPNGNGTHAHSVPLTVTSSAAAVDLSAMARKLESPAIEPQSAKAEILEFPAKPELMDHLSRPGRKAVDLGPSRDLRFWRIACVAAGLAIAALLLGVNWSRTPQPTVSASPVSNAGQGTSSITRRIGKAASPDRQRARVLSEKPEHLIPLPAKPSAAGATLGRVVTVPRKDVRLGNNGGRRVANSSTDDSVARDTVTYFDPKGCPSTQKPLN
jgi:hypothetical protein